VEVTEHHARIPLKPASDTAARRAFLLIVIIFAPGQRHAIEWKVRNSASSLSEN